LCAKVFDKSNNVLLELVPPVFIDRYLQCLYN
jgi:hypothetical protein